MPTKGYDDADNISRVRKLMAASDVTRRQAIISVVGPQNLRRVEMKMRRLELALAADPVEDPEAARRAALADRHAELYPARLHEKDEDVVFEVFAPEVGPTTYPDGTPFSEPRQRFVYHAAAGRRDGVTVGEAFICPVRVGGEIRKDTAASSRPHKATQGLKALGLAHEVHDGMVQPVGGVTPVLRRLADELAKTWAAGIPGGKQESTMEDLFLLAADHEAARLERSGLGRVRALMDERAMRLVATLDHPVYRGWRDNVQDKLQDGTALALLDPLTPFLHGCLYNLGPHGVRQFEGKPRELLTEHLRNWVMPPVDSPSGGSVSDAEVEWLFRLFQGRPIPPLGSRTMELLLTQRHAIDEARAATDRDAAGLASIFRGIVERDEGNRPYYDWRLRKDVAYVMGRINDGPDAVLGYGEVAARLRAAGREIGERDAPSEEYLPYDPIHQALRWVLRAQDMPFIVLDQLVMPSCALAMAETLAIPHAEAERRLRSLEGYANQLFLDRVMELAVDISCSGRDLEGMAAMGREAEEREFEGKPEGSRSGGIVRGCSIEEACGYEWKYRRRVEQEWNALSGFLVRRWRCGGPELIQVAMVGWIERMGERAASTPWTVREFLGKLNPTRMLSRSRG